MSGYFMEVEDTVLHRVIRFDSENKYEVFKTVDALKKKAKMLYNTSNGRFKVRAVKVDLLVSEEKYEEFVI